MEDQWTAQQQRAIRKLADPSRVGTLAQLAKSLKISERTLRRWRNELPGFRAAVRAEVLAAIDLDLPRILHAIGERAASGDVPAARLVLLAAGILSSDYIRAEASPSAPKKSIVETIRAIEAENQDRWGDGALERKLTPEQVFRRAVGRDGNLEEVYRRLNNNGGEGEQ